MTTPTPLNRYVKVQKATDRELAKMLKDAADEAEAMILRLGKKGQVTAIRRAQLGGLLKQLRKLQVDAWGNVTKTTEMGMYRAGEAAAEAEITINRYLFDKAGVVMANFDEAMRIQAQAAVSNVVARGANDIALSKQVYRTSVISKGLLDKAINRALLLGFSWKELADSIKGFINPNVPGGMSYAAKRLARTEINNAFHRAQIDLRKGDPWTEGFKWHLSGSHPKPDKCNDYASGVHVSNGEPGVFAVGNVPGKPHPQCLCYLTTETIGVDDFINRMARGDFDSFIDDKIDKYGV